VTGSRIDQLHAAVQAFSNSLADDTSEVGLVQHALIVWEETTFDEDGSQTRSLHYAVTGDAAGLASSLGLADYGREQLRSDLVH